MNELTPVVRMSRDIRAAASTLSKGEARYLVDAYYIMQDARIRAAHQRRALEEAGEPNAVMEWLGDQNQVLEDQIKAALDKFTMADPVGQWMRSIRGIGPVIAAGFLAHVDVTERDDNGDLICTTAGSLWSLCGVAPGKDRRIRGQKLTFNPDLKRLTFHVGECFKRCSPAHDDAYYRHVYDRRKEYETNLNRAGAYADQAAAALEGRTYDKTTDAYKWYSGTWVHDVDLNPDYAKAVREESRLVRDDEGTSVDLDAIKARFDLRPMLPPAHIDRRCCRYAAKLFLSHMHEVMWKHAFGDSVPYPMPYAIAHLGHVDKISPPGLNN